MHPIKSPIIDIAYCTDANYLEYVSVSIKSIILNNINNSLQFHVFLYNVDQVDIDKFQKTSELITIYVVEQTELENYQHEFSTKHINNSTFLRLLVPRLLKNKVDKLLYLDADTLCFADISSISAINIQNYICAASIDSLSNEVNPNLARLNLSSSFYFNAGVLYINVSKWVEYEVEKKSNEILSANKMLKYADQDALNIVLQNHVLLMDKKWNYLFTWMNEQEKETFFYDSENLPYIIHFTGARKMWYKEHIGLAQNLYCFYKHFTPWAGSPLKSYQEKMRINDYRIYAKLFFKKKQFIKCAQYFFTYCYLKIIKNK